MRFDWLREDGRPKKPDWDELRDLRQRMALASVQRAGKETSVSDKISHVSEATERVTGFIDCLGGIGQGPFEEEGLPVLGEEEPDEPLCVEFITAEDLNEDAAFLRLHPRVRQKLLESVDLVDVEFQQKTRVQQKANVQVEKKLKNDLRRSGVIKQYHDMVKEKGAAEARKFFTPSICKKAGLKQKGKRAGKPVVMKLKRFSKTSGAAKRRAAKTKAFDNQQLAAQMAKAYVEVRALRDACSMEKQNATEARAQAKRQAHQQHLAQPINHAERVAKMSAEGAAKGAAGGALLGSIAGIFLGGEDPVSGMVLGGVVGSGAASYMSRHGMEALARRIGGGEL